MAKLNERELKILKSEVFKEQLGYLSDELGDPGRYFPFLKSKVELSDAFRAYTCGLPENERLRSVSLYGNCTIHGEADKARI